MCSAADKSKPNEDPQTMKVKVGEADGKAKHLNVPYCIDENKKLGKLADNDWTEDGAITCGKGETLDLKLSD